MGGGQNTFYFSNTENSFLEQGSSLVLGIIASGMKRVLVQSVPGSWLGLVIQPHKDGLGDSSVKAAIIKSE